MESSDAGEGYTTENMQSSKKPLSFLKSVSVVLGLVLAIVAFLGVNLYVYDRWTFNNLIENIFKSLNDIGSPMFEKTQRLDNAIYCDILGDSMNFRCGVQVAWRGKQILLGKSLLMHPPEKVIELPGGISDVRCFFRIDFKHGLLDRQDTASLNSYGLYIACMFVENSRQRLAMYHIPYQIFQKHEFSLNPIVTEEQKRELETLIDRSEGEIKIYAKGVHSLFTGEADDPLGNVSRMFDIGFENIEFQGFATETNGGAYLLCIDRSKDALLVIDCDGKSSPARGVGKNGFARTISNDIFCHIYIVDKGEISLLTMVNGKPKPVASTMLPSSDNDVPIAFLDGSSDLRANNLDCLVFYQGDTIYELYQIFEFPDDGTINTKLQTKKVKTSKNALKSGFNSVSSETGTFLLQYIQTQDDVIPGYVELPCRLLSQYSIDYLFYRPSQGFVAETSVNRFISPALDEKGSPLVLFSTVSFVKTLDTSGIDEPVDEAHVTYEDNRLTIYFMNKNSVFRWQNSEEGIGNLKLRKLDITPEPMVTTK